MQLKRIVILGALDLFLVSCAGLNHRSNVPKAPYEYERELAELRHAIEDIEHSPGTGWDIQAPVKELEDAFGSICKAERISCDPKTWNGPWATHGGSGSDLAHALGDVDRVYSRLAHTFNPHFDAALHNIVLARHELREFVVLRERVAIGTHLPYTRAYLFMLEDVKYVRSLVAEMPPADVAWDYERTVANIDAVIQMIERAELDPDVARVATMYQPDLADFAWLPYRDRIQVACDILDRSATDFWKERNPAVLGARAVEYKFDRHLRDAIADLRSVPPGHQAVEARR
jgi:hypothetical protein